MKNFPDKSYFNEVEKRLREYTEQPDDAIWNNIDKILRPNQAPAWIPWVDRIAAVTTVALLLAFGSRVAVYDKQIGTNQAISQDEGLNPTEQNKTVLPGRLRANKIDTTHMAKGDLKTPSSFDAIKVSANYENEKFDDASSNDFNPLSISPDSTFPPPIEGAHTESAAPLTDSLSIASILLESDSLLPKEMGSKSSNKLSMKGRSFYLSLTPQVSFQQITPLGRDGIVVTKIFGQPILSGERFGLQLQAGVQGRLTQRLEYYAGISIVRQSQNIKYAYQSSDQVDLQSTEDLNYEITPHEHTGIINSRMLNVGGNAGILYHLYGKKLAHKVGAGVSYQYGFEKATVEHYHNAKSQYFFYQLFYRSELQFTSRLKFFVQPMFSRSIFANESLDAPFELKPYHAGLGLGLLYQF